MKDTMNRRMFLRGASGSVMAIPFLPSLLTRAFANDPPLPPVGKCFFAVGTDHGNVWNDYMYPDDGVFTQTQPYAGRNVRYGNLPTTPNEEGKVVFSPACTANAQVMTSSLAQKFNILRGVDIPFRIGHQYGGHLGNFAGTHGGTLRGVPAEKYLSPTIDQLMAYSPSFYGEADLQSKMTQRSFCIGGGHLSWNYTSPSTKSGRVIRQNFDSKNLELFDKLFTPSASLRNLDTTIIDLVKQQYQLLRRHPRLSRGDLQRLDQHVELMFDLERKLKVGDLLQEEERIPSRPEDSVERLLGHHSGQTMRENSSFNAQYCDLMTDVIAAAFRTGTSRVCTWYQHDLRFADQYITDWHGSVAHSGLGAVAAQARTVGFNQGTFEHILVNLAAKLDEVLMPDGHTLLDHSLLMQTSEAGQVTHQTGCVHYPVITAGSAGGYFNTGLFVDFSNTNIIYDDLDRALMESPGLRPESPGLYYNQFLANVLMSMGIPKAEWETFTEFTLDGPEGSEPTKGYGFHVVEAYLAADYQQAKLVMSDKLPVITTEG